ncbi:MAG: protein-L-isoaspartate(D-aspartate) O-methyltransferase [Candidatus Thermoplasmatota archaeon]|nr:protein-L-isoaspartate(D-aspartate) O-methyltransferase [Candidatus Thermoplasmatota archaeon]
MDSLVSRLKRYGYIRSTAVEKAMLKVDRALFVPEGAKTYAYNDHPLEIGYRQTISAPHMVAIMLELLGIGEKDRVLEIGTGSGYNAALIATMAKEVYTIESLSELAKIAKENLKGYSNVRVLTGDGSIGYEEKAPYDAICVTCAAPALPEPLKTQVKEGGRIVIPVGSLYIQMLYRFIKRKSSFEKSAHGEVVFVPMRGTYGF